MPAPVVSVTICMYNASRYIDLALQSVFAQTWQDFEVIVIDDGSTDGAPDRIERDYRDPRLTVVRQAHQTLRVARPHAISRCTGEFITFIDHDDVWLPEKLARQVAEMRRRPGAALTFSNCWIIDATGRRVGRLSDRYDVAALDLTGTNGHLALLRHGNFVVYPTAMARAAAVRAAGGFHRGYQYVSDYDLWLRLARRHELHYVDDPLVEYRVHETQFTQRHPEITLPEHRHLLEPIMRSASYPADVRRAIGDTLLGQHRFAARQRLAQGDYLEAARAAIGTWRYPDRLRDSIRHRIHRTAFGRVQAIGVSASLHLADAARRLGHVFLRLGLRAGFALRRVARVINGRKRPLPPAPTAGAVPVWIDGTSLGREQTGYFNLLAELIRQLLRDRTPAVDVHVVTTDAGRDALHGRLGDVSRVHFHACGWRSVHWTHVYSLLFGRRAHMLAALIAAALLGLGVWTRNLALVGLAAAAIAAQSVVLLDEMTAIAAASAGRPRHPFAARLTRYLWRRWPAPRRRARTPNTIEVLFWRGRFKWRDSRRIAIVQDMTTRIHPELHTPGNVEEFDEFLGYAQRHAHAVTTVSESSRRDIIERIAVSPASVSVLPMPIHPQYWTPNVSPAIVGSYGIPGRYVLCVATIEPRKNLRRLLKAFELVNSESTARDLTLVLIGQQGWDGRFVDFLLERDTSAVKILGFVPGDHLPSLYHFASAVICPSIYEGFGLPVMEAMCCSSIVLASNVSSLPEVLGEDGIQFDPSRVDDIAAAMRHAVSLTPDAAASYRQRCRRRAEAHLARVRHHHLLPGVPAIPVEQPV